MFKRITEEKSFKGYFPKNCDKTIAVTYHEIGHAIHCALNLVTQEGIHDEFIREKWNYFSSLSTWQQENILSVYAGTEAAEMIAEA